MIDLSLDQDLDFEGLLDLDQGLARVGPDMDPEREKG